jgi:cytochrome c biogenesis protein CcdA
MDVWDRRWWPWVLASAGVAAVTWKLSSGTSIEAALDATVLGVVPLLGLWRSTRAAGAVALGVVAANASHFFLILDHPVTPLDAVGLLLESTGLALLIYAGIRTWRFYRTAGAFAPGRPRESRSYLSSAGVGLVFGAGWTPCTGPNLALILALAASSSTVATGSTLLMAYAGGLAVPFLAAGWLVGGATRTMPSLGRFAPAIASANAILLLVVASLALTGSLAQLAGTPWLLQRLR